MQTNSDKTFALARRRWLTVATTTAAAWALPFKAQAAQPAQRLITVGGAITEVVYALGAQDALVATDTTSLYPEAATRTPKVGYVRQLSAEGLLSLRPDVLLASGEAGPAVVLEQIKAAGVRVELVPSVHSFEEVLHKVALVGEVTGRQAQARALAQSLQQEWQVVQSKLAQVQRKPRALFILSHNGAPMVSGTGTAAHALLTLAGADNVVQQFKGYRPLTAEALAAVAPEVIVNTTQGIEALGGTQAFWRRPELALTPAFQRKALVTMEASHLLGFGPRMPSAVHALHVQLQKAIA